MEENLLATEASFKKESNIKYSFSLKFPFVRKKSKKHPKPTYREFSQKKKGNEKKYAEFYLPEYENVSNSLLSSSYIISYDEPIGKGTFGSIYKGRPAQKGAHPVAIKILEIPQDKNKKQFLNEVIAETKTLNRKLFPHRNFKSKVIDAGDKIITVLPYIPGIRLTEDDCVLAPEIAAWPFHKKLQLLQQLVLSYSILHNETPSSGKGVWHKDPKGQNIHVDNEDVYPLDYGMAVPIENTSEIQETAFGGTLLYMAPEILEELGGAPSDVYALAAIFCLILGGNPFKDKDKLGKCPEKGDWDWSEENERLWLQAFINKSYTYDDMRIPKKYRELKEFIILFLERMSAKAYDERPDIDEVLRFTTFLSNIATEVYATKASKVSELPDFNTYKIKLALLAKGLWNIPIGIEKLDSDDGVKRARIKTFEDYSFDNEKINQKIMRILKNNKSAGKDSTEEDLLKLYYFGEKKHKNTPTVEEKSKKSSFLNSFKTIGKKIIGIKKKSLSKLSEVPKITEKKTEIEETKVRKTKQVDVFPRKSNVKNIRVSSSSQKIMTSLSSSDYSAQQYDPKNSYQDSTVIEETEEESIYSSGKHNSYNSVTVSYPPNCRYEAREQEDFSNPVSEMRNLVF